MALLTEIHREEGSLQGTGGLQLHHQRWLTAQAPARAGIIVLHGIGNHGGRYADLAESIARAGYNVYALDQRGHGRSEGPRVTIERFDDLTLDLDAFVAHVRADIPGVPLFLLGHSWGGLLALSYATRRQPAIDGLVLCAAGVQPNATAEQIAVVRQLARDAPSTPVVELQTHKLTRNRAALDAFREDPLVHHEKIPAGLAAATLTAIEDVTARLDKITLPVLIAHGSADEVADPSGSRLIYERVGSSDRTLKLYEGLWHQPFNEPERDKVLADFIKWLDAHSPTTPQRRT